MTRTLLQSATSLVVAYAAAGVLSAQTAPPAMSSQAAGQPTHVTGSAARVTYTGCLKQGSDLAGGGTLTPGTSASSAPLSGFMLTSAQLSTSATPPAATAPPGQSATTTTPPATPPTTPPGESQTATAGAAGAAAMGGTSSQAGAMYRIVGLPDDQLRQFANQQVEITGVMESPNKTATVGTTGSAGQPTSSQPAMTNPATGTSGTTEAVGSSSGSSTAPAGMIQTFRATSVRVLSSSCAGGTN